MIEFSRWVMAALAGGSLAAAVAAHEQGMVGLDSAFLGICLTSVLWWSQAKR